MWRDHWIIEYSHSDVDILSAKPQTSQALNYLGGRITVHPDLCNGHPTIRGLRITVEMILDFLSAGETRFQPTQFGLIANVTASSGSPCSDRHCGKISALTAMWADAIAAFIHGVDAGYFPRDDLARSAVLHKLTAIGEAAARVSMPLRARFTEVPWSNVVGFRNIAIHAYFSVDWRIG